VSEISYFGDYEIIETLGTGGSGRVYRALQRSLEREVALKVWRDRDLSPLILEASANLDHPNIAPIYEIGDHEGQLFCSMKLIEGPPVTARPVEIARTMERLADAVAYAHVRGVLHGDLKPSNILLTDDDQPVIIDFSIPQGASPPYMAPEFLGEGELTTAADVYGLGAVLYELLAKRPPFESDSVAEISQKVLTQDPARPGGSRDLEILCLKCLSKDPAGRPDLITLREEFGRIIRGEPIRTRKVGAFTHLRKWCRRHPVETGLVIAAAAVLALGVTLLFPKPEKPDRFGAAIAVSENTLAIATDDHIEFFDLGEEIRFRKRFPIVSRGIGRTLDLDENRLFAGSFGNRRHQSGLIKSFNLDGSREDLRKKRLPEPYLLGGHALISDGEWLWVGAPGSNRAAGAVFRLSKGTLDEKAITSPDQKEGRLFGHAIAVDIETLVVGAPGWEEVDGMIAIYDRDPELNLLTRLEKPGQFGWSLALHGDFLLVGAPAASKVYLVDLEAAKIIKQFQGPESDRFGESVVLTEQFAIIGAPQRPHDHGGLLIPAAGHGPGYVDVIDLNSGKTLHRLDSPQAKIGDSFGGQILVTHGRIFVPAPRHFHPDALKGPPAKERGRVDVFDLKTGEHEATLRSSKR